MRREFGERQMVDDRSHLLFICQISHKNKNNKESVFKVKDKFHAFLCGLYHQEEQHYDVLADFLFFHFMGYNPRVGQVHLFSWTN